MRQLPGYPQVHARGSARNRKAKSGSMLRHLLAASALLPAVLVDAQRVAAREPAVASVPRTEAEVGGAEVRGPSDRLRAETSEPLTSAEPAGRLALQPAPIPDEGAIVPITPVQSRKITEILPFPEHDPDQVGPCQYMCPRPGEPLCDPADPAAPPCPVEVALPGAPYQPKEFHDSLFLWEPSNLWYNPLYFEDAPLERYGHRHHRLIQPFVSVGRFGGQLLGLPYQMSIDPVWRDVYALGWYRPGSHAPKLHYQIPYSTRAAMAEAGVLTGLFFILP